MAVKILGVTGTFYLYQRNKWRAHIKKDYKRYHIGYFDNLKDAVIARYQAEQEKDMVKKDDVWGAYQWLKEKKLLDENGNVKGD